MRPCSPRKESMVRTAAFLVVIGAALVTGPVRAQFGNFNGSPPRPPADIPNGFPAQPPPVQYPGQNQPPSQQYQPQYPAARQPAGIQAQPLPPPSGASVVPPRQNTVNAPAASPPPPQPSQAARGAPASTPADSAPPLPANTAPQSDDSVVTVTPTQKIENRRAVFSGLDKITGRTISFDAAIGETVQFGALQVTARACYTRPPTEATNTDAFVEVDEVTLQGEIKRIFTGWMFASSPGLHAVEHSVYDVWLTDCAAPVGGPVAQSTPPPAPAAGVPPATPGRKGAPARNLPVVPPSSSQAPVTDD
jgi:hypothetical protein